MSPDLTHKLRTKHTTSRKPFSPTFNLNGLLPPLRILRTARQISPSYELIHAPLVPYKVANVCGRMNRRVSFIVVFALTRSTEGVALFETVWFQGR